MSAIAFARVRNKWEYAMEATFSDAAFVGHLNNLGEKGWELVHVSERNASGGVLLYFKRPLELKTSGAVTFEDGSVMPFFS